MQIAPHSKSAFEFSTTMKINNTLLFQQLRTATRH
jgi:hypothetical protein